MFASIIARSSSSPPFGDAFRPGRRDIITSRPYNNRYNDASGGPRSELGAQSGSAGGLLQTRPGGRGQAWQRTHERGVLRTRANEDAARRRHSVVRLQRVTLPAAIFAARPADTRR